jgi:AhpD family alkylhydroperoxidase
MNDYPKYRTELQQLAAKLGRDISSPMSGFGSLHKAAVADGVLNRKTKELMAVAIAIAARCGGCIAYHVHDAIRAEATREEVVETIGVAILMGGGLAMIYGCEALAAFEQYQQPNK